MPDNDPLLSWTQIGMLLNSQFKYMAFEWSYSFYEPWLVKITALIMESAMKVEKGMKLREMFQNEIE